MLMITHMTHEATSRARMCCVSSYRDCWRSLARPATGTGLVLHSARAPRKVRATTKTTAISGTLTLSRSSLLRRNDLPVVEQPYRGATGATILACSRNSRHQLVLRSVHRLPDEIPGDALKRDLHPA